MDKKEDIKQRISSIKKKKKTDEEEVEERFVFRQYVGQFWTCTSQLSRKIEKIGTKMLHRQFLW